MDLSIIAAYGLAGGLVGAICGVFVAAASPRPRHRLILLLVAIFPILLFVLWGIRLGCVIPGVGDGLACVGWGMLGIVLAISTVPPWFIGLLVGYSFAKTKHEREDK